MCTDSECERSNTEVAVAVSDDVAVAYVAGWLRQGGSFELSV